MPREQDDSVDFVLGDAPQPPPEPSAPPPRSGWATRRTLAGAAVVLVGVGLLVRAIGGDSGQPHASASASVTPAPLPGPVPASTSASPTVLVAVPQRRTLVLSPAPPVPSCPDTVIGGRLCSDNLPVPTGAAAAVHAFFRDAKITSAYSQVHYTDDAHPTATLDYRQVVGRVGPATLLVLVGTVEGGDRNETVSGDDGRHAVGFVTRLAHGLTVRTQLTAPSGDRPALQTLAKLAADRRLVAP